MRVETFLDILGADFFAGVPDSQLRALCDCLMNQYGTDAKHHVIGANEGNCVAMAAGYYLATGKPAVVYMQNSGEGNVINPVASLLQERVYGIPAIFVIGWRGEPGVHDEPQHVYQGAVTLKLLEDLEIEAFVLEKDTSLQQMKEAMERFRVCLAKGRQVAFVIKKGALTYDVATQYTNPYTLLREEVLKRIVDYAGTSPVISTTGKASRELFEIREEKKQGHGLDFLTVGSMGHSSSIALSIALQKPQTKVWCVDGDGALLMHMGAMAVLGAHAPQNLVHVVINNGAHETVGGMPTVASKVSLTDIARGCGYPYTVCVEDMEALDKELEAAREKEQLCFIEVKCGIGSRENLGRPTTTPKQNKQEFMELLKSYS